MDRWFADYERRNQYFSGRSERFTLHGLPSPEEKKHVDSVNNMLVRLASRSVLNPESSDDVGWAPLPPEVADDSETRVGGWVDNYYDIGPAAYSFVKIVDLSRPTYRDVILTPENNVELFSRPGTSPISSIATTQSPSTDLIMNKLRLRQQTSGQP